METEKVLKGYQGEMVFPDHVELAADYVQECGEKAIARAVEVCAEAGGGTVIVGRGEWKSGPIHLRSNIHLMLEEGAIVTFSERFEDYLSVVFTRWEGLECYNYSPLIYGRDCENVAITGKGVLFGSGQAWWHWKKLQQQAADELCYAESEGIPAEKRVYGTVEAALRPSFIQLVSCNNILLQDFTITEGPQWTMHPVYCENVAVRDVTVKTTGPNTDGLNPDSCKNVLIEGCRFDTGDDCIAINSGMNEDGWRVGRPCEYVEIRNCVMTGGHGGIVIGSGMSGGVKGIYAHDLKISGTDQGIRLKSMRGRGGYVHDVRFENITLHKVCQEAVQINMYYQFSTVVPKTQEPSDFAGITVENVTGTECNLGVQILGLPEHPLRDITLKNIDIACEKAFVCEDTENLTIENVNLHR